MALGGISVLALVGLAWAGPNRDATLVPIEFEAPVGCSGADAFYAGVLARADRARVARAGESGLRVSIHLTRTPARVHGELRLTDAHGASETRKVDGATCDEVVEVLALTTALALDPSAAPTPRPPAPPAPAAPPAPTPTTHAAAPTHTATPLAVATPPAPRPAPPPVRHPASPPHAVAALPPPPAPPPPPPPAPPPPVTPSPPADVATLTTRPAPVVPRRFALEVGAEASGAAVASPEINLGAAVVLRVVRTNGAAVEPSLGLTVGYLPNDLVQSPSDVVVRWTSLALVACPGWGFRRGVAIEACALGTGGWLSATEHAVTFPRSVGRTLWGLGALARVSLALGRGVAAELEIGATAPLVKRRFVTTTPDRTVAETPVVFPFLGLGLAYRL